MDTRTINKILIKEKCYIGTYSRDTLPSSLDKNESLIVNTDPVSKPGEHWVAIIKNDNGTGEYFDSYGLPPLHKEFLNFMSLVCPKGWTYNPTTLQCLTCITCGHYCVAYIKLRCLGYTTKEFIHLFTSNVYLNDHLIKLYVRV